MCQPVEGVARFMAKKALGAPDARAEMGTNACTEFGKMVSHEVKTNPRYKDVEK